MKALVNGRMTRSLSNRHPHRAVHCHDFDRVRDDRDDLAAVRITQAGVQAFADRYTYIPLIGVFIVAAWADSVIRQNRRISFGSIFIV